MTTEMLTAKDIQELLQVDRSTIYRMAEAGRLPAIKVGKQWRFPGDQIDRWLRAKTGAPTDTPVEISIPGDNLIQALPLDCVQLIQDAFAEALDVMLVVTDINGHPVTQVSNPGRFYLLMAESNNGHVLCEEKWRELGQIPALEPRFAPTFAGLLCARALVRLGNELKGMVIVFGVAPKYWPPPPETTAELAESLGLNPAKLATALEAAAPLNQKEQRRVLITIQRIADILAHIATERSMLLGQLSLG
jgi:excisionase family DNA binding protein